MKLNKNELEPIFKLINYRLKALLFNMIRVNILSFLLPFSFSPSPIFPFFLSFFLSHLSLPTLLFMVNYICLDNYMLLLFYDYINDYSGKNSNNYRLRCSPKILLFLIISESALTSHLKK